jgi:hypothetical protein
LLKEQAESARSLLQSGTEISLPELIPIVDILLQTKDLSTAQQVFQQLPQAAFQQAPIVALFLKYLVICGETDQVARFASELRASHPDLPEDLKTTVERILTPLPEPEKLPSPEITDYTFNLDDGHYRTEMLLFCRNCRTRYREKTGWGMMVLRPSFCPRCLSASLISPDFLVGAMQRFHRDDGEQGFRQVDQQINRLISRWHRDDNLHEEGTYHGVQVAEPLMLRVQRWLVKEMFRERWVTGGEEAL